MLAAQVKQLLDTEPEGAVEALEIVDGLDDALVHGLGRIGEAQASALAALATALAATPLRDRVSEAVDKVRAGSLGDEHLAALAGGRAALLGAVHDAQLARLDAALGRSRAGWAAEVSDVDGRLPGGGPEGQGGGRSLDNLLAGCRSWLTELAITGWAGTGQDQISASGNVIHAAYAAPRLRRLAVLLDGLAAELRAASPIATMSRLPARRWADLWSRGVLLAHSAGGPGFSAVEVSGRLLILGVDLHEHETAVQLQAHGVLEEPGGAKRLVRMSISAGKTNTVIGASIWRLFSGYPMMLNGLAKHRVLELSGMPLLPSGDLVWRDELAAAAEPADPFATARVLLGAAVAPAVPPLERHPVRIAEPVLVEGYTVHNGVSIDLGGNAIDLDLLRLPGCGPLTAAAVEASSACLGLMRWDAGRWLLQPLAVQATVKKKPVTVHNGEWALGLRVGGSAGGASIGHPDPKVAKASSGKDDTVAVLRERAGRLLRK
ncbi:MAG TPA: hypothetical protein VFC19_01435 [Candidatus Limnocylindrales bacterium]|nr:hypothetical protein [Candidatus Limnocylindrales bacterium]